MLNRRRIWLTAVSLGLGCLALLVSAQAFVTAGEKKADAGSASRFKAKPIELVPKGGKVTYAGELTGEDAKFQNHYFKVFTVQLEKGKVYRIDHKNAGDDPKFDPLLFLEDVGGAQLEMNDDADPVKSLDSQVIYKAAKTGTYRIIATSLIAQQTSKFTLELAPASPAESASAEFKFRITNYADASPVERKKVIQKVTKQLADKAGKISIADAQLAIQLAMQTDDDGIATARETYGAISKILAGAENMQVAGASKFLESELNKLEKYLGKGFPITGKTVDGKEFDLKSLKGKVVLIDFWATWCGPCIAELPNMEIAYKKYHGKGFDIIAISLDRPGDDEKLSKFIENRKMPWPCINIEDSRPLATKYAVNSIPFPVLVDRSGNVVSLRARGPQLDRLLERLLAEKK